MAGLANVHEYIHGMVRSSLILVMIVCGSFDMSNTVSFAFHMSIM